MKSNTIGLSSQVTGTGEKLLKKDLLDQWQLKFYKMPILTSLFLNNDNMIIY